MKFTAGAVEAKPRGGATRGGGYITTVCMWQPRRALRVAALLPGELGKGSRSAKPLGAPRTLRSRCERGVEGGWMSTSPVSQGFSSA